MHGSTPTVILPYLGNNTTHDEYVVGTETSADVQDMLLFQFISAPLSGAQTISGTLKGQLFATENSTGADARAQMLAKVVTNDGSPRGTLMGLDTSVLSSEFDATANPYFGGESRKFPLAAISPFTTSSVAAEDGDRIVLEVGARLHNVVTTSYTASVMVSPGQSTDLAEGETEQWTSAPLRGWFELSTDPTFQAITRRATDTIIEAAVAVPQPNASMTDTIIEAAVAGRTASMTDIVIEVAAEEYWYGWGIILEEE